MAYEQTPPAGEESAESVTVPISAIKGAQVGDSVSFKVQSIDGENATLTASDAESPAEDTGNPPLSTVSKAAAIFGQGEE